jgi:hypothetical protein
MTDRHVVVKVERCRFTAPGQKQLYVATVAGREVYKGRNPYFDGTRALVDDHGYQLDDYVSHIRPDGTRSNPVTLNSLYWTEITESDRGGLRRRAWRGVTQDGLLRQYGGRQDARDGQEGTGAGAGTETRAGGAFAWGGR